MLKMPSVYPDRLGTNIGKALKRERERERCKCLNRSNLGASAALNRSILGATR